MQFTELCQIIEKEDEKIRTVVDAYRRQGRTFLMPSGETAITPRTVIDISHESLMRAWHTLRNWVDDEAQSAKIYRRLAETAALHAEGAVGTGRIRAGRAPLNVRLGRYPRAILCSPCAPASTRSSPISMAASIAW